MELPQPRPYESTAGGSLKTHDFLQPLERVGTGDISREENNSEPPMENIRPPAPPATTSIEHVLPSGIRTYSISHVSQRVPKPEGVFLTADTPPAQASSSNINDGNLNCSSYTGSGFTLWGESIVMNKGQTGKENNFAAKERNAVREVGVHAGGQWATSLERPSQSLSSHSFLNKAFSSVSSSQQSFSKKQSFMDMIKSAKSGQKDENEDDDEFVIKKEPPPHHKGNVSIKVEDKGTDQSPNTLRSKHSATEQRRRIKINDRFQMLRGLIPNSDQKRDKASFLLEVVEYIQFLQEKVQRYEGPYQGWSQEPPKMMPWKNRHRTAETFGDQSGGTHCGSGSPLVFATKFDEANTNISSTMPRGGQDLLEYEISTADTMREMDHHGGLTSNGLALHVPLQQAMYSHKGNSSAAVQLPPRVASNTEIRTSQSHPQLLQSKPSTTDSTMVREKLKDQEAIESGKISISSVYSQELLNTLTQSLKSSGVDLSQASISVQIDVANRKNRTLNPSTPIVQTDDPPNNQSMLQSRLPSGGGESEQAFKRLKTGRS